MFVQSRVVQQNVQQADFKTQTLLNLKWTADIKVKLAVFQCLEFIKGNFLQFCLF